MGFWVGGASEHGFGRGMSPVGVARRRDSLPIENKDRLPLSNAQPAIVFVSSLQIPTVFVSSLETPTVFVSSRQNPVVFVSSLQVPIVFVSSLRQQSSNPFCLHQ